MIVLLSLIVYGFQWVNNFIENVAFNRNFLSRCLILVLVLVRAMHARIKCSKTNGTTLLIYDNHVHTIIPTVFAVVVVAVVFHRIFRDAGKSAHNLPLIQFRYKCAFTVFAPVFVFLSISIYLFDIENAAKRGLSHLIGSKRVWFACRACKCQNYGHILPD